MFLENYPRKSIMKFWDLVTDSNYKEGVWLKYEDLENPQREFSATSKH